MLALRVPSSMTDSRPPAAWWCFGILLGLVLVLWVTPAQARDVAVVSPPGANADYDEIATRLHGELLAVGLSVRRIERGASHGDDVARTWLRDGDFDAVIEVVASTSLFVVDVWVTELTSGRARVSRVEVPRDAENAPEELSIRAIEVLRSVFLEMDMATGERRAEPASAPPAKPAAPPDERQPASQTPTEWGIAVGVATVAGLDGVGPAVMPLLRLDLGLRSWLAFQVSLAGLGSRPTVSAPAGSAQIDQRYAAIGARYRFAPGGRLRPFFSFSAGGLRTFVDGQATAPRVSRQQLQWSFLFDASLGAELRLLDGYYLTLAGHVQLANPSVAVHILDEMVATSGLPNLASTLTLGKWL